jgi:hypothetical protein
MLNQEGRRKYGRVGVWEYKVKRAGSREDEAQFIGRCWLAGAIDDFVGKHLVIDILKLGHARPDIKCSGLHLRQHRLKPVFMKLP